MDLQEIIKRVLRGDLINESKVYLLRRVSPDKLEAEFRDALDTVSYRINNKYKLNDFKKMVISMTMDGLHGELSNWGTEDFPYDEIEEHLLNKYSDVMTERYYRITPRAVRLNNTQEDNTLNESFKDKLINLINSDGIVDTSKFVSGYDNLIKLLGDYQIPKSVKIKTIRKYMDSIGGGVSLLGVDIQPIPYRETNKEYQEIVYLGFNSVIIDRWGGYENQSHLGELEVKYEDLTEKTIDDILEIILNDLTDIFFG
jgi:hypothetical protein